MKRREARLLLGALAFFVGVLVVIALGPFGHVGEREANRDRQQ